VAWLSIGIHDPGRLLTHLNRLSMQLAITGTAVIACYEPASKTLHWARAGHPPPLLARHGSANELDRPRGLLLGAEPEAAFPAAAVALQRDDLLLLYTDGLVERRPGAGGDRLEQVRQALSTATAHPDEQALRQLRDRLHEPSPDDDTCVLAVRVLP
jgi:serine phosphatase RsbU (regulator of sigma subunit)